MPIYKRDQGVELGTTEKKASSVAASEGIRTRASNRSAALPSRSNFRAVLGKPSLGAPVSWSDES